MVRDLESLIEYLYLKFTDEDLLKEDLIVNPTYSDQVIGKTCIINNYYQLPDLRLADSVINRLESGYESARNPFIRGLRDEVDGLFVFPRNFIFYFSRVPGDWIYPNNCFNYLDSQIKLTSLVELPMRRN